MRIAIGNDHRGIVLKPQVLEILKEMGQDYEDLGTYSDKSVHYPDIAKKVGQAVVSGRCDRGILICGTGIGMCIAANKVKGIRAAMVINNFIACRARQHNDINVMCLGAENDQTQLREMIDAFLTCKFEGGHHQHRLDMLKEMENQP